MKKFILILILCFFINCKNQSSTYKLEIKESVEFKGLKFEKVFEASYFKSKWCVPVKDKVVCKVPVDFRETEYIFYLYDCNGKVIKERRIRGGDAPTETSASLASCIISISDTQIVYIDAHDYVKSLDVETLEIKTLGKMSNLLKGYRAKYKFCTNSFVERSGNHVVTAFESSSFEEDHKYYFVKFDNLFENFKIISINKKLFPESFEGERIFVMDYYMFLRRRPMFSCDWKRGNIYYIPAIERPVIEVTDFNGKNRKIYEIDINYQSFEIGKRELNLYYDFLESIPSPLNGYFRNKRLIPPHAPPLQGIKVVDDWLVIITGKRNWEKGENMAIVYKLPSLKYEGSFYIPFPNYNFGPYVWTDYNYIKTDITTKNSDYYYTTSIYRVIKK
jgi:hypothetical protein